MNETLDRSGILDGNGSALEEFGNFMLNQCYSLDLECNPKAQILQLDLQPAAQLEMWEVFGAFDVGPWCRCWDLRPFFLFHTLAVK